MLIFRCEIIHSTRRFRQSFDTIKQRTIRICSLAKTLINVGEIFFRQFYFFFFLKDFSIAAEFKCHNYVDLWNELRRNNYSQVKLHLDTSVNKSLVFPPFI